MPTLEELIQQKRTEGIGTTQLSPELAPGIPSLENLIRTRRNLPQIQPGPRGFLLNLLDKILTGQYISAGIAREILEKRRMLLPQEIPEAAWKGIQQRATYREVAERLGIPTTPFVAGLPPGTLPPWAEKIGLSPADVAGLMGDIFLDPLTYLGLGIATRGVQAGKRFGLTFARRAIPGLAIPKTAPAYQAALRGLEALKTRPTVQALRGAFSAIGRPVGVTLEKWAKYLPMARAYRDIRRFRELEVLKETIKMAKGVTPQERVAIMHALERPFKYTKSIEEIKELIPVRKEIWEQVSVKTMPWADRIQKLDQAIEEAVKQYDEIIKPVADDLAKEAREAADLTKEFDLFRRIQDLGGIAPSRTGAWKAEYRESVPVFLKDSGGRPLDEIADSLGMNVRELLEAIAERQRQAKIMRRGYESEAARLLEEAGDRAFLAVSDRLFRLNELRDRLAEMAIARGPKITQERVQRFITEMVEQPRLREIITKAPRLEPRLEARRREIAEIYRRMVPEERARGFYPRPVHHYAPHIKVEAKSPWLRFSRPRTIDATIEDARRRYGIQIFEEDAYKALALRRIAHERAILTHDFIYRVLDEPDISRPFVKGARIGKDEILVVPKAKLMFQPALREVSAREAKRALAKKVPKLPKPPDYTLGLDDFLEQINPAQIEQLELLPGRPVAWIMPKGIVDHINQIGERFIRDESTNAILRGYDKVLNLWKLWATAMRLPFHLRNFISNYWNNSLDLGLEAFDPSLNTLAWKVLRAGTLAKEELAKKITLGGKAWTLGELFNLTREKGVINTGWLGADIPHYLTAQLKRLEQTGLERAFWNAVPISQQFIVARAMRNLGLNVENHARVLNFLGNLRKELPVDQAVAHVKKHLFDYCVDDKTEILTARGWQTIYTLEFGDKVLTLDPQTNKSHWSPIISIYARPYSGELNHLRNSRFDALVTDEHRWLKYGTKTKECHSKPFSFVTTAEIRDKAKIVLKLAGGEYEAPNSKVYPDELVRIVGWHITEGSNYSYGQSIAKAIAPNKELRPEFLLTLTKRQLELLYKILIDGYRKKKSEFWNQQNKQHIDAFQMLCALLGKRCNNSNGTITSYRSESLYTESLKITTKLYNGPLWCVTTKDGTWYARRNGFTYWTGNSELSPWEANVMRRVIPFYTWSRKNIALQLEYLLKKPGQYAALAKVPNFARWIAQAPPEELPDWAKDQLMIRLPFKTAKGTPVYMSPDLPPEDLEFFGIIPGLSDDTKIAWSKQLLARLTPAALPIWWVTNYNAFFAAPRFPGRTTRAPFWIDYLPQAVQQRIGVTVVKGEKRIPTETAWMLSQLPVLLDIERVVGGIIDPMERAPLDIARYLTGLRLYAIPPGARRPPQRQTPGFLETLIQQKRAQLRR